MRIVPFVIVTLTLIAGTMHAGHADFMLERSAPDATFRPAWARHFVPVRRHWAHTRRRVVTRRRVRHEPGHVLHADAPPHADAPSRSEPLATGFGHDVPIAFAVRQIVPPDLHVAFANGIDRTAIVDWTGGAPWNVVLEKAVQPLGYRVSVAADTVHIDP